MPALPAREVDSPVEDVVPDPFEIDDGLPEVSVEKPEDLVEVDVGDLGLPRVEDYLPRVDVGGADPLPADVEGYEPSEAGDPKGESPDPAHGVGDDEMEVDASLLEPTFEPLEALPLVVAEDFADKVHFKVF